MGSGVVGTGTGAGRDLELGKSVFVHVAESLCEVCVAELLTDHVMKEHLCAPRERVRAMLSETRLEHAPSTSDRADDPPEFGV